MSGPSPARRGSTPPPGLIQTAMRERDYARPYETSDQRAADFPVWTRMHDWHRPHAALAPRPSISSLWVDLDNLLMHHKGDYPAHHHSLVCHWPDLPLTNMPWTSYNQNDTVRAFFGRMYRIL